MFMYINAYMHTYLSMYTRTHTYRQRGAVCAVLQCIPGKLETVAQAALSNPTSSDSRALGLQPSAFFSLSNCFVSVRAQIPQGKHLEKAGHLGVPVSRKMSGQMGFPISAPRRLRS